MQVKALERQRGLINKEVLAWHVAEAEEAKRRQEAARLARLHALRSSNMEVRTISACVCTDSTLG
jgi:hypothetical protein